MPVVHKTTLNHERLELRGDSLLRHAATFFLTRQKRAIHAIRRREHLISEPRGEGGRGTRDIKRGGTFGSSAELRPLADPKIAELSVPRRIRGHRCCDTGPNASIKKAPQFHIGCQIERAECPLSVRQHVLEILFVAMRTTPPCGGGLYARRKPSKLQPEHDEFAVVRHR